MIAVDTNILVYAHRAESPWHAKARAVVEALANGATSWAIPWPCLYEFFAVVTHPRVFSPPTALSGAIDQVDAWLEAPTLSLLSEAGIESWAELRQIVAASKVTGPRIHDARIAAICRRHDVRELFTADRDFARFPSLKTRNPLIG